MKVKCIQCKKIYNKSEWVVSHEECELCTSHTLYTCPKCGDSDEYLFERVTAKEYKILNQYSTIPIFVSRSLKKTKEELQKICDNSKKEGFIVKQIDDKQCSINGILIQIK